MTRRGPINTPGRTQIVCEGGGCDHRVDTELLSVSAVSMSHAAVCFFCFFFPSQSLIKLVMMTEGSLTETH